jgi:hypothetical protein
MSGYVFISYSSADRPYADKLAQHLKNNGISVWHDFEMAAGDRFDKVIKQQIDGCAAFIVVMTPEADQSRWVFSEVEYAISRGKSILPLLLRGDVFFSLQRLHYEDVRAGTMPGPEFVARLSGLAGRADTPRENTTEARSWERPAVPAAPVALGQRTPLLPTGTLGFGGIYTCVDLWVKPVTQTSDGRSSIRIRHPGEQLRFYTNGDVIAISATDPSSLTQSGCWFNRKYHGAMKGRYRLNGGELTFSCKGRDSQRGFAGKINVAGHVDGEQLRVQVSWEGTAYYEDPSGRRMNQRPWNGDGGERVYTYCPIPGISDI